MDATCNGFKHLALLSNEAKLFIPLNLSSASKKDDPKDFYTYMLNKLILLFKESYMSDSVNQIDKGSYKRLNNLVLSKQNIKQAIMTIPYNASLI